MITSSRRCVVHASKKKMTSLSVKMILLVVTQILLLQVSLVSAGCSSISAKQCARGCPTWLGCSFRDCMEHCGASLSTPTSPPNNNSGGAQGDPHFTTWSGEKYDFHGVCDLVLLSSPNVDIHIRTQRTRSRWSFIHAAAIRIGKDIIEVMGGQNDGESFMLWVNQEPVTITTSSNDNDNDNDDNNNAVDVIALSEYNLHIRQLNHRSRVYAIDMEENGLIIIKTWNGMVSVNVQAGETELGLKKKQGKEEIEKEEEENDKEKQGEIRGLMGMYPDGRKVGRSNNVSDEKMILFDDNNQFGQEWQVIVGTDPQLFHSISPTNDNNVCEVPSSTQLRRRLGEVSISKEDAELACSRVSQNDFDLCVFDVMATNDQDSAGAY